MAEQAELLRVSQAAARSLDLATVLREVARASIGIAGAEACGIYLWRSEAAEFEVGHEETIPEWPGVLEPGARMPAEHWPSTVRALRSRTPFTLKIDDPRLSEQEQRRYAETDVGSVLCLPLVHGDVALGCLKLFTRADHDFTPREARFGQDLAAQAAMAINNARLLGDSLRIAEERAAMLRVGQAAISSLDLETVLKEIARATLGLAGAERCAILLWRPDLDEAETAAEESVESWRGGYLPGTRIRLADCLVTRQALERQTPLILDPRDAQVRPKERASMAPAETRSWLMAPLVVGEACLGALLLFSRQPRAFDSLALRIGQEIAAVTALAIQNARLLDDARRHVDEQGALLRVSRTIIEGQPLAAVLREVTRSSLAVEAAEACEVGLWRPGNLAIEIAAKEPWQQHAIAAAPHPAPLEPDSVLLSTRPSTLAAMEAGEPRSFLVDDPTISARERAGYVFEGTRSVLIIPLMLGAECLGCLTLTSSGRHRFTDEALRFGRDLAAQAAQAMDRARLFDAIQMRADTDGLTSLLNHRAVQEALDRDLAEARETGAPLSVILIDLDDFKLFNDTHGHLVGDRVLAEAAALIRGSVRGDDRVARYGGDEFLLVLPGADAAGARDVAGRILDRFARATVKIAQLKLPLRLSVGVASYPDDGRTRQTLIAHADAAMYAAKLAGGGRAGGGAGLLGATPDSAEVTPYGALGELVRAVDQKDRYTRAHSERVMDLSVRVGQRLGLSPEQLDALEIASRLHDVGKVAVPDAILRKPGGLTPEEEASLRQHVLFSTLMVQGIPHQATVLTAIANHHERWDGKGYPAGLQGADIPLLGRILGLTDAFAAMTHDRPYRKGRTMNQAFAELRREAGGQFDPDLIEPFIEMVTALATTSKSPRSTDADEDGPRRLRLVGR